MKYRKLRIAWSVVWGVLCVLLIALWVRSYWVWDDIHRVNGRYVINVGSNRGIVYFKEALFSRTPPTQGWGYRSDGSAYTWTPVERTSETSHSAFVVPVAIFAAAPWVRWRFSLRTLLIVATLVAVLLGIVAMMLRGS